MLSTRRLELRPLRESDTEAVWLLENDPEVQRFVGSPASPERSGDALQRFIDSFTESGIGMLAVEYEGRFSGLCGLLQSQIDDGTDLELICMIDPELRGHGLALEASQRVLQWAFRECHLARVLAQVSKANQAGLRLASKLGMTPYKERTDPVSGETQQVFQVTSPEAT